MSKVINISYSENILNWIGEAISISAKEAKLREALVQYEELLEKICGKDIDYTMEIKDYILKNADNYDFVKSLETGLAEARVELQDKFWKRLEARLEEHLSREYGLDMSKVDKTKEIGTSNKWYSLNLIKKKSRYFGLIYNLGNFKNLGDLYLKVEIERNLIFGIRNVESHIENTLEYSNMLDVFKQNNFILTSHDSWLSYKHVKDLKGNRFDLYDIDKDFAETIMYDEKLDALISSCIEQIDVLLKLVHELEKN